MRILWASLLLGILIGVQALADEPPSLTVYCDTLKPYSQLLVNARLNDRTVRTFLVDTGCNASMISSRVVSDLKLTRKPAIGTDGKRVRSFLGKQDPADMVTISRFKVGSITFPDVPLIIADEKEVAHLLGNEVDGIIGTNFFVNGAVLFQFPEQKITYYYLGQLKKEEVSSLGFSNQQSAPIEDTVGDFKYFIHIGFGSGVEERVLLDTGAQWSLFSLATARALNLSPLGPTSVRSFMGNIACQRAVFPSVSFAGVTRRMVTGTLKSDESRALPSVIGLDLLSSYDVLVNYPEGVMYIRPARK